MTVEELSQLQSLNREIERQRQRLGELEGAAVPDAMVQIMGMPRRVKGVERTQGYEDEIDELKGLIAHNLKRCLRELTRIERLIGAVEDSQMRQILSLRYVNGLSWQQIAFSIGEYDEQLPRRQHNAFLRRTERDARRAPKDSEAPAPPIE